MTSISVPHSLSALPRNVLLADPVRRRLHGSTVPFVVRTVPIVDSGECLPGEIRQNHGVAAFVVGSFAACSATSRRKLGASTCAPTRFKSCRVARADGAASSAATPPVVAAGSGGKISLEVRGGRIRRQPIDSTFPVPTDTESDPVAPDAAIKPESQDAAWFKPQTDVEGIKEILFGNPLNLALFAVPFGLASEAMAWGDTATFFFNFFAIIPLASILGTATEELVFSVGPSVGGLLNATLGNAVEMIIGVYALREGLVEVVKGSLVGSIISNLLLVMGMCFFCGGIKYKRQNFSAGGARTQYSLLLLSVLALALPTVAFLTGQAGAESELLISRACAGVLAMLYGLYLYFQLNTHPDEFESSPHDPSEPWPLKDGVSAQVATGEEEEDEEREPLSLGAALIVLAVSTVIVAACSEGLTGSVEGVTKSLGISERFVGIVLLPIVGNAAEHLTAVTVATKDKMDLSLGVALGSSTQIALFVVPFTIIVGSLVGAPMDLNFSSLPTAVMLLTVLIVGSTISDGSSNWLEGAMLIGAYLLIACVFWFI